VSRDSIERSYSSLGQLSRHHNSMMLSLQGEIRQQDKRKTWRKVERRCEQGFFFVLEFTGQSDGRKIGLNCSGQSDCQFFRTIRWDSP
jgi:hypothetical protein